MCAIEQAASRTPRVDSMVSLPSVHSRERASLFSSLPASHKIDSPFVKLTPVFRQKHARDTFGSRRFRTRCVRIFRNREKRGFICDEGRGAWENCPEHHHFLMLRLGERGFLGV